MSSETRRRTIIVDILQDSMVVAKSVNATVVDEDHIQHAGCSQPLARGMVVLRCSENTQVVRCSKV